MVFSEVNGKAFPEHAGEKIFQIGQAVQKLLPYFNVYVNVTQYHAIHVKCMYILSSSFGLSFLTESLQILTVVVDKGTSGCQSITSSIYF